MLFFDISDPRAPIEDDEMLSVTSDIPVTEEDRSLFDYISLPADWPDEERDVAIGRITNGNLKPCKSEMANFITVHRYSTLCEI